MSRRIVLIVAAAALLLGTVAFQACRPKSPINRDNLAKLSRGQTRSEVEVILGGPGGGLDMEGIFRCPRDGEFKQWSGNDGIILVSFDRDGKVWNADFYKPRFRQERFLDKLRRWLGI
jgi:hypothetical protein